MDQHHAIKLVGLLALALVMVSGASASCVAHWSFNDTGGLLNDCDVLYNLTNFGATSGASGMYAEAYDFNGAGNYAEESDDIDLLNNFTISSWVYMHTNNTKNAIVCESSNMANTNIEYCLYWNTDVSRFTIGLSNATNFDMVHSTTNANTNTWYHVLARLDGTNLSIWINNTMENSAIFTGVRSDQDTGAVVGKAGDTVLWPMDGVIDEVWLFNRSLTDTEINLLFTYNSVSLITLDFPASAGTTSGLWNFTPALDFDNCTLFANDTASGLNATSVTAGASSYVFNDTLAGDGVYSWYVGCQDALGAWSNSTTRTSTLDTTGPVININSPVITTQYYVDGTVLLNATYTDNIDLFNCTYDVYFPNDTLWLSNSTACSGTTFTWDNYTTPVLPLPGTYRFNFSAMDSHTAREWKGQLNLTELTTPEKLGLAKEITINENTKKLSISNERKKETARVLYDSLEVTRIEIEDQHDRKKYTYLFSRPIKEFKETLTSEYPIYIVEDRTRIPGHMVFGDQWFDAEEAVTKEGWKVTLKRINDYAVEITYTHDKPQRQLDPATGGLNFGSAEVEIAVNGIQIDIFDENAPATPIECWDVTLSNGTTSLTRTCQNNTFTWGNFTDVPTGEVSAIISKSGYVARYYYGDYNVGIPLILTGYLLEDTSGVYSYFYVRDRASAEGILNARLNVYRFIGGEWTLVQERATDSVGATFTFLSPYHTYNLTATHPSYETYTTSSFTPLPETYVLYLDSTTGTQEQILRNGTFYINIAPAQLTLDNGTIITTIFNDPDGLLTNWAMHVNTSNGTSVWNDNGILATGGTLTFNTSSIVGLVNSTRDPFYVTAIATRDGTTHYSVKQYYIVGNYTGFASAMEALALTYTQETLIIFGIILILLTLSATSMFGFGSSISALPVLAILVHFNWFPQSMIEIPTLAVVAMIFAIASRGWK